MPLGILDVTEYEQFDVELDSGDCVLSYTDALIESRDADGEMLGEAGLLRIMRHLGDVEPQILTKTLLREIKDRYPEKSDRGRRDRSARSRQRAINRGPGSGISCGQTSALSVRSSAQSIPWAERPPFPDLNVANIGGAIIPSLEQRWRAAGSTHRPPNHHD